jgi:hypothetical protein
MPAQNDVELDLLIQRLIDVNTGTLRLFTRHVDAFTSAVGAGAAISGPVGALISDLLVSSGNGIGALLTREEQLQTGAVESFYPPA